jgi:hypothetical protein
MKKRFPLAAIAVFVVAFTSCKKDYTCTCYKSTNGVTNASSTTTIHEKKDAAESQCKAMEFHYNVSGTLLSSSCSIK